MLFLKSGSEYANIGESLIEGRSCDGNVMSIMFTNESSKSIFLFNNNNNKRSN